MKVFVVVCHYEDWGNESCDLQCPNNRTHIVGAYSTNNSAKTAAVSHTEKVEAGCVPANKENSIFTNSIHPFDSCNISIEEIEVDKF